MRKNYKNMYNFDIICRTCLKEGELNSLFREEFKTFVEMLYEFVDIKVLEDDKLPHQICTVCLEKLESAYLFKKQCLDIHLKLQKYINDTIIKEEKCQDFLTEDNFSIDNDWDQSLNSISKDNSELPTIIVNENKSNVEIQKKKKAQRKRSHQCPTCYKMFTYTQLRFHIRAHTKEKPHKCEICNKAFSLKGNYQRHIKIHTGERPHKCNVCGRGFIQTTTLYDHIRIHTNETPFSCKHCGKSFKQSAQLRTHIRNKHNPGYSQKNKFNSTKVRPVKHGEYACEVCNSTFSTKSSLSAHSLIHGEKKFLCNNCGKRFVNKFGLVSHLKSHTGEKPYKCNICDKTFSQISSLKTHQLIHSGERPYQCSICSKTFTQRNHLTYHNRVHSGEKPYKCSVCNKQFSLNGTLTVHMRTHTGETPYICHICNKGFYDSSSMKKHQKKHILNSSHDIVSHSFNESEDIQ